MHVFRIRIYIMENLMQRTGFTVLAASGILLAGGAVQASGTFNIVQQFEGGIGGYANPQPAPLFSPYYPPDINGAVGMNGTNEVVTELLNGYYGVYTPTGVPVTQETMGLFWQNALGSTTFNKVFGSSGSYFAADPRILYDPTSHRWFASSLGINGSGTSDSFLVAVSNTSNPGGTWSGFSVPSNASGGSWADFDTLAVNGQNVYLTGDMFRGTVSNPVGVVGADFVAIPKAAMTAAAPSVNGYRISTVSTAGGYVNQPVQEIGSSSANEYFYSGDYTNQLNRTEITGTSLYNYSLSQGPGSIAKFTTATAASAVSPISQPGTTDTITANDSRLSSNLYMINGLVWGTQVVTNPTDTTLNSIRYFAVSPTTNKIVVQGTISDSTGKVSYAFPSIAVSATGDVVIDFSGGGSTQYMSTYVVTGSFNGSNLSLSLSAPQILSPAGSNIYVESPTGGTGQISRWGDYSTIWADPLNPHDFWIFQELPDATNPNQWDTWITQIDPPFFGPASAVPEPGALLLLFLGAAPLLLTLRRRKAGS